MKYLYSVAKNGIMPVIRYEVIKETPKTYVVKGGVSERVLKSTMSNKYCVFFEDEKSAQLFYERVKYNPKKTKRPKKPITHFDRIKDMSINELTQFLFVHQFTKCSHCAYFQKICSGNYFDDKSCTTGIKLYLESEVQE